MRIGVYVCRRIRRQKLCVGRIQCKRKDEEYDVDDGRVQGRGGGEKGRERHRNGGREKETESEKETWRSNGHPRFPF